MLRARTGIPLRHNLAITTTTMEVEAVVEMARMRWARSDLIQAMLVTKLVHEN